MFGFQTLTVNWFFSWDYNEKQKNIFLGTPLTTMRNKKIWTDFFFRIQWEARKLRDRSSDLQVRVVWQGHQTHQVGLRNLILFWQSFARKKSNNISPFFLYLVHFFEALFSQNLFWYTSIFSRKPLEKNPFQKVFQKINKVYQKRKNALNVWATLYTQLHQNWWN